MKTMHFSFVIPCYRSEQLIEAVLDEIEFRMFEKPQFHYEIITVNDASPDQVLRVLMEKAKKDQRIKVIDLAKNAGKHAALMAGYQYAQGEIVVSLDDDGQCPLDHLWELVEPLEQGFDISIAKYPVKKQSAFKNFGSRMNDFMARALLHKPKELQISNFSAMKRFICQEILKYKNPYPYIDGLFLRSTGRIANVLMEERNRSGGASGYTFWKSLSLWLNGFTAFSVRPLRIATAMGGVISTVGFLFGVWVISNKLLHPEVMAGYSSLMAVLLFLGGMLMLLLGLIGEYIGRIYICLNCSPQYVIREKMNFDPKSMVQKES